MNAQYRIDQLGPVTWRLSVADEGGWRQINTYGSQGAAAAGMADLVTQSQFVPAAPQYFDATGLPIIGVI
jgi:hypothetical protein